MPRKATASPNGIELRSNSAMAWLRDIVVYEGGCATYDLPREAALSLGLRETASHPQTLTHHLGLYFMASRGAVLASSVRL